MNDEAVNRYTADDGGEDVEDVCGIEIVVFGLHCLLFWGRVRSSSRYQRQQDGEAHD